MIHDVDDTLAALVESELGNLPGSPWPSLRVTFNVPGDSSSSPVDANPRVNLCLHDIRENVDLRDETFIFERKPGSSTSIKHRAPVYLNLSYLVTAHTGSGDSRDHQLLSDVLGVFLRSPAVPQASLRGSLAENGAKTVRLHVALADQPSHSDLPSLWQAIGGRLSPSLPLVVTAPYDPFTRAVVPVVREAVVGVGQGPPLDSPRRPLDHTVTRVSVAGIVTSADMNLPLPGVNISVLGREERTTTDQEGFFYLLNLPAGSHTISFKSRSRRTADLEVQVPDVGRPDMLQPLMVALDPLTSEERSESEKENAERELNLPGLTEQYRTVQVNLSGRLTWPDERPAAYIPVRVGKHKTTTDSDGVYVFTNLAPGDDKVFIKVPGREEEPLPESGSILMPSPMSRSVDPASSKKDVPTRTRSTRTDSKLG